LAFGAHPKKVDEFNGNQQQSFDRISDLMSKEGVVAFGEIGLDYSKPTPTVTDQKNFLERLMRHVFRTTEVVQNRIPIVVHCRDNSHRDKFAPLAHWDTVEIFQRVNLPKDHPIQLHYCHANEDDITTWLEAFPNTVFSFGETVKFFQRSEKKKSVLKRLDPSKILLESDAQGIEPKTGEARLSPYSILETARLVAGIRGMTVPEVLRLTSQNAYTFFNVRPDEGEISGFRDSLRHCT